MDTGQLRAFERIVREGGYGRAARALGLTQPTITARIQALETVVGGPLFARAGRGVALTERGESFLTYARRALAVLDEGIEAAQQTEDGRRGRVSVGTMESLVPGTLVTVIHDFRATHPDVDLLIRTGHSEQIHQMLDDGLVRLGLVAWPMVRNDFVPLLRVREPLVLAVAPRHPLAVTSAPVELAEVARRADPLYVIRWSDLHWDRLARLVAPYGPVVEIPSISARMLVLRRHGAALFPRSLIAGDLAAGTLIEVSLAGEDLVREFALIRPAHLALSAAAEAFLATLRATVGPAAHVL